MNQESVNYNNILPRLAIMAVAVIVFFGAIFLSHEKSPSGDWEKSTVMREGSEYSAVSEKEIRNIPDSDPLFAFPRFSSHFLSLDLALAADKDISSQKIEKKIKYSAENQVIESKFQGLKNIQITSNYKNIGSSPKSVGNKWLNSDFFEHAR